MRWSKEEEEFLTENWGNLSIKAIAKKLNRSENAIEVRKTRLGLGSFLENGEYINLIGQDKLIELIKISKDKKEFYTVY